MFLTLSSYAMDVENISLSNSFPMCLMCLRPSPDDVVPSGGEMLEEHYSLNPKAALMLEAVPRPAAAARKPPGAAAAAGGGQQGQYRTGPGNTAASYYNRMGQ
jgi:hypothetical protein